MNERQRAYQAIPYPKLRRALALTLRSARRKPMMHGLIEVDVTKAHEFLRNHKATTGKSLSFTAFIITCLAQAVETMSFDHSIIDGAPAARFSTRLRELIENGYGLINEPAMSYE